MYVLTVVVFFCCNSPGRLPRLHSFPTRRFSDLMLNAWRSPGPSTARSDVSASRPGACASPGRLRHGSVQTRSEEHTSEHQSLTNLVCRLLVGKKQQQIYAAR